MFGSESSPPELGKNITKVEVFVNKVKVIAIVDTRSPVNVVSTKLVQKIKLAPDLTHSDSYGTAGLAPTTAMGAYSAIPLRFGKFIVTAPAIVLPSNSYDLLLGTQFLQEYSGIIDFKAAYLSLLSYKVPLIVQDTPKNSKTLTCYVDGPTTLSSFSYEKDKKEIRSLPYSISNKEGIPLRSPSDLIYLSESRNSVILV